MIINLSDMLLHESRLTQSCSLVLDLAPGGHVSFGARQFGVLHMVLSGTVTCWPLSGEPVDLGRGDSIVFFYRDPHVLGAGACQGEGKPFSLAGIAQPGSDPVEMQVGEGEPVATVFTSLLQTAYLPKTAFSVRAAPDFWLLRGSDGRAPEHPASFDPGAVRGQCRGPGAAAFANALTSLVLIQVVRNVCAEVWGGRDIQILAPIERQVAAATREISANINRDWTVESLAKQVGISRSAFAKAFHLATGETPMAYITAMRMQRAAELMAAESLPLREVAERVGYRLETSFARAFKKFHGTAPRRFVAQRAQR